MCGEIENEMPLERQIIEHFRGQAELYLANARSRNADGAANHNEAAEVYMDRLFAAILRHCVDDLDGDNGTAERLRGQAIVLARLSGLLAGQLPAEFNTLHATMDATLVGYSEGQEGQTSGDDHHHHH